MADWLILKKNPDLTGAKAWYCVHLGKNKTADAAGATEALMEAIQGPGKYGVIRADNGRTVRVEIDEPVVTRPDPTVIEDSAPEF
jgi:hypothetical protein